MSLPFELPELAAIANDAATLVCEALREPLEIQWKTDGSPVTAVDRAVDAFLKVKLQELLPAAGWLSEESADDRERLNRELVWIVDPIDGTKQLIHDRPEIAISIGLASAGRVIASAVVNPQTGESGIWLEGGPPEFAGLAVRPVPQSLETAVAIVSRTESEAGNLVGLEDLVGSTRPVGSVAYKLLRVAARADALTYSVKPKSEWDVCGGVGLLVGSGAAYLRLDGAPLRFNSPEPRVPCGAVAGPLELAEALRAKLNARLASRRAT